MSNVFHAGDYHFFHKNIARFRPIINGVQVENEEHHRELIIANHNSVVTKRDVVYLHGDIIFQNDEKSLAQIKRLNGNKVLILGNHDKISIDLWKVFSKIHGLLKYKNKYWLSHAPIHPDELRGRINIHGHVHYATLDDNRYFNCSLENIGYKPIALESIREKLNLT